ncbi:MAG TPA: hypothetical protein VJJ46_09795 [Anaerolineales bacterium]|nr:hypothetical protein [Anaerolineales bacterium]
MRHLTALTLAGLAIAAAACNLPPPATPDWDGVYTMVAGTLTASAPTLAPPSETGAPPPTEGPAGAEGRVCYPSEGIPAMTAYFQNMRTGEVSTLEIEAGQALYEVALPPGTYLAYAWMPDYFLGGAYTLAVPCGLGEGCTDHTLIAFTVAEGTLTEGIDLCDWYGPQDGIPLPPGVVLATRTPTRTSTLPAPPATSSIPGGITGNLGYPSEGIPQLVVVAFNIDTGYWWWVGTATNQSFFAFSEIPAGRYQIVAYAPSGLEAAYANGTSLRTLVVEGGQTVSGINLTEWFPAGTFRAKPGGISYP